MGVHGCIYLIFMSTVEGAYVQGCVCLCVCVGGGGGMCVMWDLLLLLFFCFCFVLFSNAQF